METSVLGIVNLAARSLRAARRAHIPDFSGPKAKHVYTQPQLLALLVVQQRERKTFRELQKLLEEHRLLCEELGLRRAPHWTTLHKALRRLGALIERLFGASHAGRIRGPVALDGTGFSSRYASKYYQNRIRETLCVHRHVHSSIAVDTRRQLVLAHIERDGPTNDFPDALPLLRQLRGVSMVVADKGYDSMEIRAFVTAMGARSQIPVRVGAYPPRGRLRRNALRAFNEKVYHRRSIVETVNSVVKRKYGEALRSRAWPGWRAELTLRYVAYNLEKGSIQVVFWMMSTEPYGTSMEAPLKWECGKHKKI